jgi:hypothetical protein
MADQLTPLGVEFSRYEMERIFSSVNPDAEVREWGMGRIYNPHGVTTYFDRVFNLMAKPCRKLKGINKDKNPREPGRYHDEDNAPLAETNELVHPSVRIRYLYGGHGLDDKGVWNCGALVGEGCYSLRSDLNLMRPRQGRQLDRSESEYHCVVGVAVPYYGAVGAAPHKEPINKGRMLVRVEQPNWFKSSFNDAIINLLPLPERRWFWLPKFIGGKILEEEHLGIWEQKFIHINDKLLKERRAVGTGAERRGGASRDISRGGLGLPKGCSEYRLLDVNKWENWNPA